MFLPGLSHHLWPIVFDPTKQGHCHREQGKREFFLGNFDQSGIATLRKSWATLRVGEEAFEKTGEPYPKTMRDSPYLPRPVFTDRNEALEKHYKLYTSRKVPITKELLKKAGLPTEA